jgi:hypothetical protein
MPLPLAVQQVYSTTLPAQEIKSRKENLHIVNDLSNESTATFMTAVQAVPGHDDTRKVSQPAIGMQSGGLSLGSGMIHPSDSFPSVSTTAPPTASTSPGDPASQVFTMDAVRASSNASNGSFAFAHAAPSRTGTPNLFPAGLSDSLQNTEPKTVHHRGLAGNRHTSAVLTPTFSEKGNKRTRTFTPASARAIDEEDEPRRGSPGQRMGSFGALRGAGHGEEMLGTGMVGGMQSTLLGAQGGVDGLL